MIPYFFKRLVVDLLGATPLYADHVELCGSRAYRHCRSSGSARKGSKLALQHHFYRILVLLPESPHN
jgi:hypothetical protein